MTKKQQHVPGMRRPSRAERRGTMPAADEPLTRDPHPLEDQAVQDVRAKSSGHRKRTADKWNQ
jgi:hypothetical protein